MSLQELKRVTGTTEQEIEANVLAVKETLEDKSMAELVAFRASTNWPVVLKDAEACDEDVTAGKHVVMWIQGLSEAYDVLFELLEDCSAEEKAIFWSKEQIDEMLQEECKSWLNQDAALLMETASKKWPITIQGAEVSRGENAIIGRRISCYLQGLYIGYYNIMERIEFAERKAGAGQTVPVMDLERLTDGLPMTKEKQIARVMGRRKYLDREETRDVLESAVKRYPITLAKWKEQMDQEDRNLQRYLQRYVSCYLYGMEAAYDDLVDNFTNASAEVHAFFEHSATTEVQVMYLLREHGQAWGYREAEDLSHSCGYWDVRITGFEVMEGENRVLSKCGECYLLGMYAGYRNIARAIQKDLEKIHAEQTTEQGEAGA